MPPADNRSGTGLTRSGPTHQQASGNAMASERQADRLKATPTRPTARGPAPPTNRGCVCRFLSHMEQKSARLFLRSPQGGGSWAFVSKGPARRLPRRRGAPCSKTSWRRRNTNSPGAPRLRPSTIAPSVETDPNIQGRGRRSQAGRGGFSHLVNCRKCWNPGLDSR
jgi:hypothetical protein